MASSLGLPSGARPCAASDSRGLIFAAQPVIRPIARAKSVKRKIVAVNVRMRFINLVITQSWMKQQQFGMDSWILWHRHSRLCCWDETRRRNQKEHPPRRHGTKKKHPPRRHGDTEKT